MSLNQRKKPVSDAVTVKADAVAEKKHVHAPNYDDGPLFKPMSLVLLVVAIAALGFAVIQQGEVDFTLAGVPSIPPQHLRLYPTPETIVKEDWPVDKPVAKHVVGSPRPRVFQGSFVTEWTAMSTWNISNPDFIKKIAPKIANVYTGTTSYFGPLYRENKPMSRIDGVTWSNPYSMKQMDKTAFFSKISGASSEPSESLYYTGDLNSPQLARDLASPALERQRGALLENQTLASPSELSWREFILRPQGQRVNVWVGERGVVTHLHVDSYENFFVQVQGVKRFLLFPPQDLYKCDQFPYVHPSFGQSQVHPHGRPEVIYSNATEADLAAHIAAERALHPNMASTSPLEVVLTAGDLLYLPPYWGHHVETLRPSISINFWSNSAWQGEFDAALQHVVRHGIHEWSPAQRRTAAAVWMRALLSDRAITTGLPGLPTTPASPAEASAAFHAAHLRPRFAAMISEGLISLYPGSEQPPSYPTADKPVPSTSKSGSAPPHLHEDEYSSSCRMTADLTFADLGARRHVDILKGFGMLPPETQPGDAQAEPPTNAELHDGLWQLGTRLSEMMARVPAPVRGVYLGNLFESLALWATGHVADNASEVAATLHCMAHVNIQ